ncbi:MAG TPA: BPSS1780 family membrane protein [Casimicrobiaceae bacterium]|nr:BPSS1780 family membrane protein [Casimicrobiaceae bacterium]
MNRAPIAFTRHDARRGIAWLKAAYAMFRRAPLAWLFLLFTYYLLVAIAGLGPWAAIGQVIAGLLKPVFAVGFLAAAWTQERGGKPKLEHLFRGFRSNLYALIALGVVFIVGMTLAVLSTMLVDGGIVIGVVSGAVKPTEEMLAGGKPQLALLLGALCALPTLLALWFAPALVVFHDAGAVTALGTSLTAAMANWRAVAAYGIAVFALGGVLPGLALSIAQFFGESVAGLLGVFLVVPYLFAFVATLHISDYVSFRDVFHADEPMASGGREPASG